MSVKLWCFDKTASERFISGVFLYGVLTRGIKFPVNRVCLKLCYQYVYEAQVYEQREAESEDGANEVCVVIDVVIGFSGSIPGV
jgi:hypothetical protein